MNEDTSNEEVLDDTSQVEPEDTNSEPSDLQEEPQIEKPQVYAGKYKSPGDLEKAYLEAQRKLSEQGAKIREYEAPKYTPDEAEVVDQIKKLGFMTKQELEQQQIAKSIQAKDEADIAKLNLSENQVNTLKAYSRIPENLSKSMTELWDELQGTVGGKVISRTTTIKPKAGTKTNSFKVLDPIVVSKLPKDEYVKYWEDFAKHTAE